MQRYTKEVRIVITATAATRHTMDEKEIERRKKRRMMTMTTLMKKKTMNLVMI